MKPTLASLVLIWSLGACSAAEFPTPKGVTPRSDDANLADIDEVTVERVSTFDLDGSDFRVTGVRAGLQDFLRGETPALFYNLPERADYVEIIRCKADTTIKGTFEDLTDVDLGSPSLDEEARAFQSNDFWRAAAAQVNQCIVVSTGFSGKVFLDAHVDTGSYRYLVRACVAPEKIADKEYGLARTCSRQVALSPVLADFQNRRARSQQQALGSIQQFRDRVDGLGRELHYLAVDFNNAYALCQKEETDREVRVRRKEAIEKILGFGVALGLELALPEDALASVQAGQKTWRELWTETWEKRDAIAGTGSQVGTVLQWLFSSSRDFSRTCTAAKEIAMKAETKSLELRNVHQELAMALDAAKGVTP